MTNSTEAPMEKLLDRLWIDLAGQPWLDLSKGKTLRALHHEVAFLLVGPYASVADAQDEARQMQAESDVSVVLVLIGDEDLNAIDAACGWTGTKPWAHLVPVRDIDMNGVGSIRLNTVNGTNSPCEHGYLSRFTAVARRIRKNDLFMVVDRDDQKRLLVYRALADYDPRKNRVRFARTTPGVEQPERQYMELPPNLLVYISMEGIEEAEPLSERDLADLLADV